MQPADESASKEQPVTWQSLPRKSQLAVLTIARLSEPLARTSLSAYLFYQLRSFDPSLSDATISFQAGLLSASFTGAQFFTAMLWGRAADSESIGRKRVLLVGLLGTALTGLGYGYSKTFAQAIICRTLGGALNGNMGVLRTMISEIVKEKKSVLTQDEDEICQLIDDRYQSRAFLLLPMCFNIGVIIGPILGGILADPVYNFPTIFGEHSILGGETGIAWMRKWPYAFPNLVCAAFLTTSAASVFFCLDETLEARRHKKDYGRQAGKYMARFILRRSHHGYTQLQNLDNLSPTAIDLSTTAINTETSKSTSLRPLPDPRPQRLPFRQIWTPNVLLTLLVHFLLYFHISAFNGLIFILLPAPRASTKPSSAFHFTGGLGLPSSKVGLATAVIGVIGLPLQLLLYPRLHTRWGTLKCYRFFLPFSPLAYTLTPFLVLLPARPYLIWPALVVVLGTQVLSRTFALPGAVILINNSTPSPSVLGTIHGVGQSVSSAGMTVGPLLCGWGLGLGMKSDTMGAVWWAMAAWAMMGWALSWTVREGNGGVEE